MPYSARIVNDAADAEGEGLLPPQPVVPGDPVEQGLPNRSAATTETGSLLDYVPLPATCVSSKCKIEVSSPKSPVVGYIDPQGQQHSSGTFSALWNQLLYTVMVDRNSLAAQGSVLLQSAYWQLIAQDVIPANTPHTIEEQITSGLSQTDATEFSYTLGAKVGGTLGQITAELSASLTKSFTHSVTVSQEESITRTFSVEAQPVAQVVGIYQLMQTFQVEPGANLTQFIASTNKNFGPGSTMCKLTGTCFTVAPSGGMVYKTPTYLQIVASDEHPTTDAAASGVLGATQARQLAESALGVASP